MNQEFNEFNELNQLFMNTQQIMKSMTKDEKIIFIKGLNEYISLQTNIFVELKKKNKNTTQPFMNNSIVPNFNNNFNF